MNSNWTNKFTGQYDKCIRQLLAQCQGSTLWGSLPTVTACTGDNFQNTENRQYTNPYLFSNVSPTFYNLIQPKTVRDIVTVLFSHCQLTQKNALVVALINGLSNKSEITIAYDLKKILKALTELGASGNAKVAISARELLMSLQTPSYELRRNQVGL